MPESATANAVEIEATYFRYSSYDVPLWVRANTTNERWNAAGDGPTQYLSATPDGAWAELIRNESLRSEARSWLTSILKR